MWQTGTTNPQLSVTSPGTYEITATNTCDSVTVGKTIQKGICSLILSTAFSPNGVGQDDIFRIKYHFETRQFAFTIFNRWGEKIFQSNDIRKGWDGRYQGQLQPAGGNSWLISHTDMDNRLQQAHGTVLLIR
jgi:large repetitive protein